MITRFIAGQFRSPAGFFGRLVGRAMARGNKLASRWTISLLNLQADSRSLEVGFGPGVGIQYASEKAVKGLVAGIDSSKTMVQVARKRNAGAIASGIVDLKHGEVSALPFQTSSSIKRLRSPAVPQEWRDELNETIENFQTSSSIKRLRSTASISGQTRSRG